MGNLLNSLFGPEENNRVSYESATRFTNAGLNYYYQDLTSAPVRIEPEGWNQGGIQQQSWSQTVTQNQGPGIEISDPSSQGRAATNHYTGLITMVLRCPEAQNWALADYTLQPVRLVQVLTISNEYETVSRLFRSTNKKAFKITRIDRIQNPYLLCAFLLKKEELKNRLGYDPQVLDLFHGTKRSSVESICQNNFDWRRHGEHVGARYGKGVSFSPISNYATYYSDDERDGKVMLLVKVLVGRKCLGKNGMILPPGNCDTTEKDSGHVIVKYEDNEFYPAYKITYDFTGNYNPKSRAGRKTNVNLNYNYYVDYDY